MFTYVNNKLNLADCEESDYKDQMGDFKKPTLINVNKSLR